MNINRLRLLIIIFIQAKFRTSSLIHLGGILVTKSMAKKKKNKTKKKHQRIRRALEQLTIGGYQWL